MSLLIKNAKIISPESKYHNSIKDVFINAGIIEKIGTNIAKKATKTIRYENLHLSVGWIDMQANLCDPGFEYKEDIDSGLKAAAAGGFTKIVASPQTYPVIDSKSSIEYLLKKSKNHVTHLLPIGSLTKGLKSKELAELFDMHSSGAIGFSNGKIDINNPTLLKLGLLYCKNFDGLIILNSHSNNLNPSAVMHEGKISTSLGLEGSPSIEEEIAFTRDIAIVKYTNGKLHFGNISSNEAINAIKQAKKSKLNITVGVNAYNLLLTDDYLTSFDSNFKVRPPLRDKKTILALINGLRSNAIDVICSDHIPENIENKKCEFEYAKPGMIGLQTAFSCANTALKEFLSLDEIIQKFTTNPRKILGLNTRIIENNEPADLTLFNPDINYIITKEDIISKSKNSPFIGMPLIGKPLGVINGRKFFLS